MPLEGTYAPGTAEWARKQAERFEASGGQTSATIGGAPIVVVTSVGARTGLLRKTALMRVEHEGRYAAVASQGGSARDPVWVHNLRAHPLVELQDGPVRRDFLARELDGEEYATWWHRSVEAFPNYAGYQRRTRRRIPVFLLEPVDG